MAGTAFHSAVDGCMPFERWIRQIYSLQNNNWGPRCPSKPQNCRWFRNVLMFDPFLSHFHHFWAADGKLQGMILPGTPSENMEEICFRGSVDLLDCWLRSSSRRLQMRVESEHLCIAEVTYSRLPRLFSRRIHWYLVVSLGLSRNAAQTTEPLFKLAQKYWGKWADLQFIYCLSMM